MITSTDLKFINASIINGCFKIIKRGIILMDDSSLHVNRRGKITRHSVNGDDLVPTHNLMRSVQEKIKEVCLA